MESLPPALLDFISMFRPLLRAEVFDSFTYLLCGLLIGEAKHGTGMRGRQTPCCPREGCRDRQTDSCWQYRGSRYPHRQSREPTEYQAIAFTHRQSFRVER